METFLSFDKFITPTIIKVLYWIAMVVVVISGIVMLISGIRYGGGMVLMGIAYIVLGPLVVRIQAELIMLAFRIYEVIVEIRDKGAIPPAA
jgi:hypothetical protein